LSVYAPFYMLAVCVLPDLLIAYGRVPFYSGGFSLIVIVVAAADFLCAINPRLIGR
jgi:preprotein translocase subunit SecY